jgi:hypothetical protein
MTTTSDGVAAIRLWTQYHRAIGVDLFYMFVNGQVRWQLCHSSLLASPPRCAVCAGRLFLASVAQHTCHDPCSKKSWTPSSADLLQHLCCALSRTNLAMFRFKVRRCEHTNLSGEQGEGGCRNMHT